MDTVPRTGVSSAGAVVDGAPDVEGVADAEPPPDVVDADVVDAELAGALGDVPLGAAEELAAPPVEPVHPVTNSTPAASAAPIDSPRRRMGER